MAVHPAYVLIACRQPACTGGTVQCQLVERHCLQSVPTAVVDGLFDDSGHWSAEAGTMRMTTTAMATTLLGHRTSNILCTVYITCPSVFAVL